MCKVSGCVCEGTDTTQQFAFQYIPSHFDYFDGAAMAGVNLILAAHLVQIRADSIEEVITPTLARKLLSRASPPMNTDRLCLAAWSLVMRAADVCMGSGCVCVTLPMSVRDSAKHRLCQTGCSLAHFLSY